MGALWQGLAVQRRVILALMLRETHTIYGDAKLGYLWVLIQSAFGIAVFWGVREFVNAGDPHGMSVSVYLIIGFGVWSAISVSIDKCMHAFKANRSLITFPQVTELDVMVSRVLVSFFTQLVVILLLLFIASAMGAEVGVDERARRIRRWADAFELTGDLAQPVSAYSHGMKQKLAILSALVHAPRLLLMDEPFVGLDPKAAHQLKTVMRQLCDEGGAIFFSTHVLEVAEKLCDKVAILRGGKLVRAGSMDEVRGDDSLEEVFLELEQEGEHA